MNISPIHYHDEESVQSVALGTPYAQASTGRVWKYAENGAAALGAGKVNVAPVVVADHVNMSFNTAPAVGDTSVKIILGATLVAKDQYRDGYVVIQDGTGEGHIHPLDGHAAYDSAANPATFFLGAGEQILEAGALSEVNVDLIRNRFKDVIIPPDASQTDVAVGVANKDITADYFFMIQTWGAAAVWHDEAAANLGESLTFGAGVAGQVEGTDAATEQSFATGGAAVGVADEYQLVYLRIEQ